MEVGTAEQAVTDVSVWHATQNGRTAEVNWDTQTGGGWVNPFETRSTGSTTVLLNFGTYGVDASGTFTEAFAWGQIAPSDLEVSPDATTATLHTTTGSDFVFTLCTFQPGGPSDCNTVPGEPQTLDVTWTKNSQMHSFSSGITIQTGGGLSFRTQGSQTSNTADASGFVSGVAIPTGAPAYIADSNSTTVQREITKTAH